MEELTTEKTGDEAIQALRDVCQNEGLPVPFLPDWATQAMRQQSKGYFATRTIETSPYDLGLHLQDWCQSNGENSCLIAFDGHGMNSWFVHYYLVEGPLAIFFQPAWGGALLEEETARRRVDGLWEFAQDIRTAAQDVQQKGLWPQGKRLIIVESDKEESFWAWAPESVTSIDAIENKDDGMPAFSAHFALLDLLEANAN